MPVIDTILLVAAASANVYLFTAPSPAINVLTQCLLIDLCKAEPYTGIGVGIDHGR